MSLNNILDNGGAIQSWKDLACDNLRLNSLELSSNSAQDLTAIFVNGSNNVSVPCKLVDLGVACLLKIGRVALVGDNVADVEAFGVIPAAQRPLGTTSILAKYQDLIPNVITDVVSVTGAGDIEFQSLAGTGLFDTFEDLHIFWLKV